MFSFVSKVLIKFDVIGRQHPRSMHEKTRDSVEKNVGGGDLTSTTKTARTARFGPLAHGGSRRRSGGGCCERCEGERGERESK